MWISLSLRQKEIIFLVMSMFLRMVIFVLSIPYDDGFKISVDGKKLIMKKLIEFYWV